MFNRTNFRSKFRTYSVLFIAFAAFLGSAQAAGHVSDTIRRDNNEKRLAKIHKPLQPKFRAVLTDLEAHGYKPQIDAAVWRSKAEQAALVAKGNSKVYFSYHNASTPQGKPDSLAADITDARWGWKSNASTRGYWLRLANSGRVHGLHSGAYFGLSTANKTKLKSSLIARNFLYSGPIGWDPAHLEAAGVSLNEAKAGKRPKYS
jgi:hypothetical protein